MQSPAGADVTAVASGAAVVAVHDIAQQLATHQRDLVGVDMEVYGLFAAAAEAARPAPKAFSLKAVSDFADEEKDDSFRHYACYISAETLRVLAETQLARAMT